MAPTKQLVKPQQESVTKQESLVIAQQLIQNTFSCIAYLRGLFKEDAFQPHDVHGMEIKALKRGSNSSVDTMLDWLEKGCFDALEKGYLKTIVLGIFLDPQCPNDMIESYTFNITYNSQNHPEIEMTSAGKVLGSLKSNKNEIQKATVQVMRTLLVLMQTLVPLPDGRYLTMKLHYYDEITPPAYEPPLFRPGASSESVFYFSEDPAKLRVGKVDSHFHKVDVKMYTIAEQINEDLEQEHEKAVVFKQQQAAPKIVKVEEEIQDMDCDRNREVTPSPCIEDVIVEETPCKKVIRAEDAVKLATNDVDCFCGDNCTDLSMVQCDCCANWQHMFCAGFKDDAPVPKSYHCYKCRFPDIEYEQKNKFRKLLLLRRALGIFDLEGFESCTVLNSRLSLSWKRGTELVISLKELGVLKEVGFKRYALGKVNLTRILEQYLSESMLEQYVGKLTGRKSDHDPNQGSQVVPQSEDEIDIDGDISEQLESDLRLDMIEQTQATLVLNSDDNVNNVKPPVRKRDADDTELASQQSVMSEYDPVANKRRKISMVSNVLYL